MRERRLLRLATALLSPVLFLGLAELVLRVVGFGSSYEFQMTKAQQKKFTGFQRHKTRDIVRTHYHDF